MKTIINEVLLEGQKQLIAHQEQKIAEGERILDQVYTYTEQNTDKFLADILRTLIATRLASEDKEVLVTKYITKQIPQYFSIDPNVNQPILNALLAKAFEKIDNDPDWTIEKTLTEEESIALAKDCGYTEIHEYNQKHYIINYQMFLSSIEELGITINESNGILSITRDDLDNLLMKTVPKEKRRTK